MVESSFALFGVNVAASTGVGGVAIFCAGRLGYFCLVSVLAVYEFVACGSGVFAFLAVFSYVGGEFSALNCYISDLVSIYGGFALCRIVLTGLNNDFSTNVCPYCVIIVCITCNVGIYFAVFEYNVSCEIYVDTTENFNVFDSNVLCYDTCFTDPQAIRCAH